MIIAGRRASLLLFVGDLIAFAVSLYLTLWLRYGSLPHIESLAPYTVPFALLFALWVLVFYSSGLYSKRFALFPSRLPDALFQTQLANILFAAIFFFLIPSFGITPKTILALYFVGGETTKNCALTLAVGITAGNYSSIFLASPLLVSIEAWQRKREERRTHAHHQK